MGKDKLTLKYIWGLVAETYDQFLDDKAFKMAAALSYYAAFSLGPLLIIVLAVAGFVFGEEAAKGELSNQMNNLIGNDGAAMVETIIKGAANKSTGIFATIVSIVLVVLGSLGVFIELQESLNIIWGVEPKPGRPIWGFIKVRLNSFSMVIGVGFLLMISLLVNSAITLVSNFIGQMFSSLLPIVQILNIVGSFIIISLLFALIFKYLPDVIISWRYVWLGALLTSFLFSIGKYLIGLYLGNSSYSSTYGAAASFVVLFIWIFYSGLILFFGAEFTQVYRSKRSNKPLLPDADGIIVPKVSQLIKKAVEEQSKKPVEEQSKKAEEELSKKPSS